MWINGMHWLYWSPGITLRTEIFDASFHARRPQYEMCKYDQSCPFLNDGGGVSHGGVTVQLDTSIGVAWLWEHGRMARKMLSRWLWQMDAMRFCTEALVHRAPIARLRPKQILLFVPIVSFFVFHRTGLFIRLRSPAHSLTLFLKSMAIIQANSFKHWSWLQWAQTRPTSGWLFFLKGWQLGEIRSYF